MKPDYFPNDELSASAYDETITAEGIIDSPETIHASDTSGEKESVTANETIVPENTLCQMKELIDAITSKDENTVLILLQTGINPNITFTDKKWFGKDSSPLLQAVRNEVSVKLIKLLLQYGAKSNYKVLRSAFHHYDPSTIKLLIDNGADPNYPGVHTETALHAAICTNNPDQCTIIKLLIKHGVPVDIENECYNTPLFYAEGHENISKVLLAYGAQPCYPHIRGSPLRRSFGRSQSHAQDMIKYAALQVDHSNDEKMKDFFSNFTAAPDKQHELKSGRQYLTFAQQCMAEINILKQLELDGKKLTLFDFAVSYGASNECYKDSNVLGKIFKYLRTAKLPIYSEVILRSGEELLT